MKQTNNQNTQGKTMKGNTRNEEEKRHQGNGGDGTKGTEEGGRKEEGMEGERKSVFFTLIRMGKAMRSALGCGVPVQRAGMRALGSGNGGYVRRSMNCGACGLN